MKGTQTVFAGHPLIWWLRGAVQGYSEPNFDLPSRNADFVNEQAEELLPLVEIESVDGGRDLVSKAFNSFSQPVLLSQLFALVDQRSPLRLERAAAQFQFLTTTQQVIPIYEIGLIEIGQVAGVRPPRRRSCDRTGPPG